MCAVAMEEAVSVFQEVVAVSFLAGAVRERLEEFVGGVALASMDHPVQRENAERYVRGLLQAGPRKSLEPLVERLAGEADYQSLQQFLADSPWDPGRVIQAVAERVAPVVGAEAWVLDDTGFPKDGKRSPGVKRRYSATRHTGRTPGCAQRLRVAGLTTCSRSTPR
jgi:SRSO17 transposase